MNALLRSHPDVFMSPNKEPWFFALEGVTEPFRGPGELQGVRTLEEYQELFAEVGTERAIGEASTLYLFSKEAPANIVRQVPNARLIAVLRNPVERAYSNYLEHRWEGREPLADFGAALDNETARAAAGWSPFWQYRTMGLYGEQLERYFGVFDQDQLRVFLFEDFIQNRMAVLADIASFLEIDAFPPSEPVHRNAAGIPRNRTIQKAMRRSSRIKSVMKSVLPSETRASIRRGLERFNLTKPDMPEQVRQTLIDFYRDDIRKVEEILKRDLSRWIGSPSPKTNC